MDEDVAAFQRYASGMQGNEARCSSICNSVLSGVLLLFGVAIDPISAAAADVHALFNLADPAIGPFPSDQFTVPDPSQITGRRVALPKPDCGKQASDCDDIAIINSLDGFNLQPRIAISFDGAIDPSTVTSKSISLVEFGSPTPPRIIGINQVVWDPATNTLYMTSDESLAQHTQFALVVTKGILDTSGNAVKTSSDFTQFMDSGTGDYRDRVRAGLDAAVTLGIARDGIVTASTFTTLSATAILEKIRDQIHGSVPEPASFVANGARTVFARSEISSIVVHRQTRVSPPGFTDVTYSLAELDLIPDSVSAVAFGTFVSPNYLTPQQIIPQVGTLTESPAVQGSNTLVFVLVIPSGPKPAHGWPVAIVGHYNNGSKEDTFLVASILAKHGFATIGFNIPGHGFGPLGTTDVKLTSGATVSFPSGGRGVDLNGDNVITINEGLNTLGRPYASITQRDARQQAAADLMQLVRVMQVGMDIDGDGQADLDASRLYYFGSSLGANYGTLFLAVEPGIRSGAVSFVGGSLNDSNRLGANRSVQSNLLQQRIPPLINSPGITQIGGLPLSSPYFNENKPLRDLPVVINDVAGAIEIQRVFDYQIWINQPADPVAYAPYLRKRPLPGMTAKPMLLLIAKGDETVPVPTGSAVIRAGDLADVTTYFRFDLAYTQDPKIPTRNPHIINYSVNASNGPTVVAIATGMQEQVATFFETNGAQIIHPASPAPGDFFEVPIKLPLPENIEYITSGPPAQPPLDAATYQTALSPGALFSIFGPSNSVGGEQNARSADLPTTLGGIMVSINGRAAPLFYVGSNQINGQLPYETAAGGAVSQVIANGISGAQVPFAVSPVAPRIFIAQDNLCIAQNEDGTLNSPSNPVKIGHYIGVYLIGLGAVEPPVATGAPAPTVPLSMPPGPVSASLGGREVVPKFVGMIPGYVGLAEVDILIPSESMAGPQSFSVIVGNVTSNACQIAVVK